MVTSAKGEMLSMVPPSLTTYPERAITAVHEQAGREFLTAYAGADSEGDRLALSGVMSAFDVELTSGEAGVVLVFTGLVPEATEQQIAAAMAMLRGMLGGRE